MIRTLIWGIVIAFLALVLYVFVSTIHGGGFYKTENPLVEAAATGEAGQGALIHALAIDMSQNGGVTLASIESGDDAILAIKAEAKSLADNVAIQTGTQQAQLYVFNGVQSFLQQVKNFQGFVNETDPFFRELQVVTLKRFANTFRVMPLSDAGVHALYFDDQYLQLLQTNQAQGYVGVIGYAVMNDSSQRELKIVAIPLSLLQQ